MRTEIRRTRAWLVIPFVGLTLLWGLAISPPSALVGRPHNTLLTAHVVGVLVLGMAAIPVAAWESARARDGGVRDLEALSRRDRLWIRVRPLSAVLLVVVVTFLVLTAAALVVSYLNYPLMPDLSLVIVTVAFLAMQVAWGGLCGVLLGRFLGGLLGVIVCYLVCLWGFYTEQPVVERLFPVIQQRWDPILAPRVDRLLASAGWLILLTLCCVMVQSLRRRWQSLAVMIAVVTVTSGAGLALGASAVQHAGEGPTFARVKDTSDPHICRGDSSGVVCVYAMDEALLPGIQSTFAAARAAAGDLPLFPPTIAELGLRDRADAHLISPILGRSIDQDALLGGLLQRSLMGPHGSGDCLQPPTVPDGGGALWEDVALRLLHERARSDYPGWTGDSHVMDQLRAMPRAQQNAWLVAAGPRLRACEAPPLPVA